LPPTSTTMGSTRLCPSPRRRRQAARSSPASDLPRWRACWSMVVLADAGSPGAHRPPPPRTSSVGLLCLPSAISRRLPASSAPQPSPSALGSSTTGAIKLHRGASPAALPAARGPLQPGTG
jgi:hypothetical protein